MFTFTFPSIEAMREGLSSPAMLALAEDANGISTGGAPIFLFGA